MLEAEMQLHSLVISEPVGIVSGFASGLLSYHVALICGATAHESLIFGCLVHFLVNSVIAGHLNLLLLDVLALVIRIPATAGSALWMSHFINSGRLF
jgi:hypothetical protein